MIKFIYFFYVVVALAAFGLIVTTLVDEPQTKLPCRKVGDECRRW